MSARQARSAAPSSESLRTPLFRALRYLFACLLFTPLGTKAEHPKPELKIGAIISLSGGLEQYGYEIQRGYELAKEDPSPVALTIVVEDDRSVNKMATVAAARKLVDVDAVDVLLNWSAASSPPLTPIVTAAKVPLIVGAYDSNVGKAGPYVFGVQVNYDHVPLQAADFMVNRLGAKKIAVISVADYWSQNFPVPFRRQVEANGGTILFEETVEPTATDLKSLILRAQKLHADGIFAPIYGSALLALLKQSRTLHFKGVINGADGIFEEDVRVAGPEAEGVYATQVWVDDPEFKERVQKRFGAGRSALQLGMIASAYDGIVYLREIAEQIARDGGTISRESILARMKTHRSKGILGEIFPPEPPSVSGERNVVVRNGKFELAD